MKKFAFILWVNIIFFLFSINVFAEGELKFFELGNFTLENGSVIKDCKVGYRTYGRLNEDKSNVVFFPTWFAGTSEEIFALGYIGPGKAINTDRFFVIAFDNIGNGVSSSPSNSHTQKEKDFPAFNLNDMLRAGYLLVAEHLKINRLHAIVGISMGGAQVFQWITSYPDLAKKAVSISGTTKMTSYDILFWQSEIKALTTAMDCIKDGNVMHTIAPLHMLASKTPDYFVKKVKDSELPEMLKKMEESLRLYNPYNWLWQLKAIMAHDVFKPFNGSEEMAAKKVTAKLLVITAEQDYMVNPEPSLRFARLTDAKTLKIKSECGHYAFICDLTTIQKAVSTFLETP